MEDLLQSSHSLSSQSQRESSLLRKVRTFTCARLHYTCTLCIVGLSVKKYIMYIHVCVHLPLCMLALAPLCKLMVLVFGHISHGPISAGV